jgi:hypothetical protein
VLTIKNALVASSLERSGDDGCQLGELGAVRPVGEQLGIAARPVTYPMGGSLVPAGQREFAPRAYREGDPRYPLVPRLQGRLLAWSRWSCS